MCSSSSCSSSSFCCCRCSLSESPLPPPLPLLLFLKLPPLLLLFPLSELLLLLLMPVKLMLPLLDAFLTLPSFLSAAVEGAEGATVEAAANFDTPPLPPPEAAEAGASAALAAGLSVICNYSLTSLWEAEVVDAAATADAPLFWLISISLKRISLVGQKKKYKLYPTTSMRIATRGIVKKP